MRRRDLIKIFAGSAVGWPLAVQAQQPDRMRRVSVLLGVPASGIGKSKLKIPAARMGTARNMSTVAKLVEMSATPMKPKHR